MKKIDFIAEISSNHNRDLERMKDFIHASNESGCTGVKFQLFKIDDLFAQQILNKSKKHRDRKNWELPEKVIPELSELSKSLGLKFSCTPFYLDAVNVLEPYVDFYKIASYELLWENLFKKCGKTGKPIVFSTGMANKDEIQNALKFIQSTQCKDVTVLHCNSSYPTPVKDANLSAINTIKECINPFTSNLNISVGYSDHTASPEVMIRAIFHYDISFVEFHIDLDGRGEEYMSGHCWLPDEISKITKILNLGIEADGNGKIEPSPSELPDREWRADPFDGLRPLKHIRDKFEG